MHRLIVLPAGGWLSKESAHDALQKALSAPAYYGRNLDALSDVLTSLNDVCIVVTHCATLRQNLPGYGDKLLNVFASASEENPAIWVKLMD